MREYSGTLLHLPPKTKQKPISKTMKPIISTTIILGAISLLLLFQACKDDNGQIDKAKDEKSELQDSVPVDRVSLSSDSPHTDRVLLPQYDKGVQEYKKFYGTVNQNIHQNPIKIELKMELLLLLAGNSQTTSQGLVLHYGMSLNHDSIHYILSAGSQNNNMDLTSTPFPNNGTFPFEYILLHGKGDGYSKISNIQFCLSKKRYRDQMMRKTPTGNVLVKNDVQHPLMVYHQGSELYQFIAHNTYQNPTHLFLTHGAENLDNLGIYHVPYLSVGNNLNPFPIDNLSYGVKYDKKALDIGHACPPHCSTANDPRKICP